MTHCTMGVCMKCWGAKLIVIGALVLANWYWRVVEWAFFIGALLVLLGIMKFVMPVCGHCADQPERMPSKKKGK